MTEEITPIFTADTNNSHDMELLKQYFGADAINKALGDKGNGHQEILDNAAIARLMQKLEAQMPPEIREQNKQLRQAWEREAAIRRQTRDPEETKITGTQMSLF